MKNYVVGLSALTALLLPFTYSCSSDDEKVKISGQETIEVSFAIPMDEIVSKVSWTEEAVELDGTNVSCPDPDEFVSEVGEGLYDSYATILIAGETEPKELQLKLRVINGTDGQYISTEPVTLSYVDPAASVQHSLKKFIITKKGDASSVVYSTVETGSKYTEYVDFHTPYDITFATDLAKFDKKEVGIQVHCAVYATPADMGYSMFTVEALKTYCVPYMVNVCENPCDDQKLDNQHKIGDVYAEVTRLELKDGEWKAIGVAIKNDDCSSEYNKFCFTDKGSVADDKEAYKIDIFVNYDNEHLVTFTDTLTVEELIKYDESCYYEKAYGIGTENGFLHFELCDLSWNLGEEIPYTRTSGNSDCSPFIITELNCESDECDETITEDSFIIDLTGFVDQPSDFVNVAAGDWYKSNKGVIYTTDKGKNNGIEMRISTTSNYLFYCICTKHDLPWIVTPKLNEGDQIKIYFKHSFNKNPLYLKKYTEIIEQSVEYTTSDASENYTLEECATGCNQLFTVNACGKYVIYLPFTNCEVNSVLISSIQIIKGK